MTNAGRWKGAARKPFSLFHPVLIVAARNYSFARADEVIE
jgi:hypothetical protein